MADTKESVQEKEYEFFRAGIDGRREGEQATDKRFGGLVTSSKFTFFFSCSLAWRTPGGGWGCLHGPPVQEQAKGHEDLSVPHPHQDVCTDDCSGSALLRNVQSDVETEKSHP